MRRTWLQIGVTFGAIAVVIGHHLWPALRADAFTGIFVLVALLPWLAPLLKSIKLPGGLEFELREEIREAKKDAAEAKGAAASAERQAQTAIGASVARRGPEAAASSGITSSVMDRLDELADEYDRLRERMDAGNERTTAMTEIVGRMLAVASEPSKVDASALLTDPRGGRRVAGYAAVYTHPSAEVTETLITAITVHEVQPFGQYWAIRALRRIAGLGHPFKREWCRKLAGFGSILRPGTDRHFELSALLREAGCSNPD